MSTPKTIQLAKSTLRGKDKEDIYPKTIDTAVAAKTIEGDDSTVDQVYLKEANLEEAVTNLGYRVIAIGNDGSFTGSSESVDTLIELASDASGNIPLFFTQLDLINSGANNRLSLEKFSSVGSNYSFTFSGITNNGRAIRRIEANISSGDTKFTLSGYDLVTFQ